VHSYHPDSFLSVFVHLYALVTFKNGTDRFVSSLSGRLPRITASHATAQTTVQLRQRYGSVTAQLRLIYAGHCNKSYNLASIFIAPLRFPLFRCQYQVTALLNPVPAQIAPELLVQAKEDWPGIVVTCFEARYR